VTRSLPGRLAAILVTLLLAACYNPGQQTPDAWDVAGQEIDSISFSTTHHYAQNYNFIVKADSMPAIIQHPAELLSDMVVDTLQLYRNDHIVVASVTILPTDTIDSVWVKVARDELTIGWLHERDLLPAVSPDDPISQFIDLFSNLHLLIFIAIIAAGIVAYLLQQMSRNQANIVLFRDIDSFYPTLLTILVATAATLYATIQLFAPESWRHFYFHPSLNPFSVPFHIGLFLVSVWAIVIVAIAAIDEARRQLHANKAIVYCLGLVAVCAAAYMVFSVTTLYYVGYPLLVAYIAFALSRYFQNSHPHYTCGSCGAAMQYKGTCPRCGAVND